MCYAGAKSETSAQLKKLLNLENLSDDDIMRLNQEILTSLNSSMGNEVTLNTANKIYPKTGFNVKKEFIDKVTKNFKSEVEQVDYSDPQKSSKTINDWVSQKTNSKIQNLVPASAINNLTRLILVNAIYFKGSWLNKFDKEQTTKEDFTLADGSKQKVDMMKLFGKKWKILNNVMDIKGMVCEFPYAGNNVSMSIILPFVGVKLEEIEAVLDAAKIKEILEVPIAKEKVNAYVPKFKLEYESELSETFKALGAHLPFDQFKADFTGINDEPSGLYISKVLHKAVVEVNEEGTEAAAATGVVMMTRMLVMHEPHEFNCNRPFLFFIHDNVHKNILFFGKYAKPQ